MAKEEFTEIYNIHAPQVLRMCRGYAVDDDEAQDLLQETFVKVWQNLSDFRGEAKLSTWIYRIAVNTCLSYLRSPKNKKPAEFTDTIERVEVNDGAEKEAEVQSLYSAIRKLPEADRLIMTMLLEEIPYEEIAATMDVSPGNLRVKIHRIKQQLTKLYEDNERL